MECLIPFLAVKAALRDSKYIYDIFRYVIRLKELQRSLFDVLTDVSEDHDQNRKLT